MEGEEGALTRQGSRPCAMSKAGAQSTGGQQEPGIGEK